MSEATKKVNHYVFLKPGEDVYILTDMCAGDTDHTHVFQVTIPTEEHNDEFFHNPEGAHMTDTWHHQSLELNDCANLTSENDEPVLTVYARAHAERHGARPFVAVPVEVLKAKAPDATIPEEFGAQEVKD